MTKDILLGRIQELLKAVNDSAESHQRLKTQIDMATNQHNALVGRLEEAKEIYEQFEKNEVETPVEVILAE